ncbi:MAG: hypothetical protein OEX12_05795 [Gammaproteobacteria bacterium]|nr:hypothetical protein [Gammaproteobacteria bacterium]
MSEMTKEEMLWAASIAVGKNLDYEQLMYSDYLYGKEDLIDDVWEYVDECKEIGNREFKKKYHNYKLY